MHPYSSAAYASAFRPLEAIHLPHARTHVLRRPIPDTALFDAMGCYPLCVFDASEELGADLAALERRRLVSLVLVTDCLTQPDEPFLRRHFDICRPYKTHYTYDARQPGAEYSKHHRDRVRRARKACETRVVPLRNYVPEWMKCYETLIRKKGVTGTARFSRDYFEALAELPQATTVAAFSDGALVSAHIWMHDDRHVYAHLAASTEKGYHLRSAFAVYDHAIQMFRDGRVIDFGGGAAVEASAVDGLVDFKKGFANGERRNFICGKILDREAYRRLCADGNIDAPTSFFPAYRGSS